MVESLDESSVDQSIQEVNLIWLLNQYVLEEESKRSKKCTLCSQSRHMVLSEASGRYARLLIHLRNAAATGVQVATLITRELANSSRSSAL
jgi:hypothetical protein